MAHTAKKVCYTLPPAELNWEEGRHAKRYSDDLCHREMRNWVEARKHVRVLSLPASNWIWEKNFSTRYPSKSLEFVGLEADPKVHAAQRAKLRELQTSRHSFRVMGLPISVGNYIDYWNTVDLVPFDMIYLDYMGNWGESKCEDITRILESGMLAKKGYLRVTLTATRGDGARWNNACDPEPRMEVTDMRPSKVDLPNWILQGVPNLIAVTAEVCGRVAQPCFGHVYHSFNGRRAAPEYSFLMKIR